jgi:hypothetical protein
MHFMGFWKGVLKFCWRAILLICVCALFARTLPLRRYGDVQDVPLLVLVAWLVCAGVFCYLLWSKCRFYTTYHEEFVALGFGLAELVFVLCLVIFPYVWNMRSVPLYSPIVYANAIWFLSTFYYSANALLVLVEVSSLANSTIQLPTSIVDRTVYHELGHAFAKIGLGLYEGNLALYFGNDLTLGTVDNSDPNYIEEQLFVLACGAAVELFFLCRNVNRLSHDGLAILASAKKLYVSPFKILTTWSKAIFIAYDWCLQNKKALNLLESLCLPPVRRYVEPHVRRGYFPEDGLEISYTIQELAIYLDRRGCKIVPPDLSLF